MRRVCDVARPKVGSWIKYRRLGALGDGAEVYGQVVDYEGPRAVVELPDGSGRTTFEYAVGHRLQRMSATPMRNMMTLVEAEPPRLIERDLHDTAVRNLRRRMWVATGVAGAGLLASFTLILAIVLH